MFLGFVVVLSFFGAAFGCASFVFAKAFQRMSYQRVYMG